MSGQGMGVSQKHTTKTYSKFSASSNYGYIKNFSNISTNYEISEENKRVLDRIDSGKEKTTTYKNAKDYLKHLDEVLDE